LYSLQDWTLAEHGLNDTSALAPMGRLWVATKRASWRAWSARRARRSTVRSDGQQPPSASLIDLLLSVMMPMYGSQIGIRWQRPRQRYLWELVNVHAPLVRGHQHLPVRHYRWTEFVELKRIIWNMRAIPKQLQSGVPSALFTGSSAVASYARRIPSTTFLLASSEIGAVAQTIPVLGLSPFDVTIENPPGIPPLPPLPAEAISALFATNFVCPVLSIFHARSVSFSPQQNSIGPSVGLTQNEGDPCRWCVLPSNR
jgi:hypothetical protein